MSSIQLVGISKDWAGTKALDNISPAIEPGSFCVLLGSSGCGKSTTLRIIAGLESASSGQVFVDGQDVTHQPPSRRGLSMVFQNNALFPHLNLADKITFGLPVRKFSAADHRHNLTNVKNNAKFDFGVAMLPVAKRRGPPAGAIFQPVCRRLAHCARQHGARPHGSPVRPALWAGTDLLRLFL